MTTWWPTAPQTHYSVQHCAQQLGFHAYIFNFQVRCLRYIIFPGLRELNTSCVAPITHKIKLARGVQGRSQNHSEVDSSRFGVMGVPT